MAARIECSLFKTQVFLNLYNHTQKLKKKNSEPLFFQFYLFKLKSNVIYKNNLWVIIRISLLFIRVYNLDERAAPQIKKE